MNFKVTVETEEGRFREIERKISIDVVMQLNKPQLRQLLAKEAADAAATCMLQLFKALDVDEIQQMKENALKKREKISKQNEQPEDPSPPTLKPVA